VRSSAASMPAMADLASKRGYYPKPEYRKQPTCR
jgi:hypothetical protein